MGVTRQTIAAVEAGKYSPSFAETIEASWMSHAVDATTESAPEESLAALKIWYGQPCDPRHQNLLFLLIFPTCTILAGIFESRILG